MSTRTLPLNVADLENSSDPRVFILNKTVKPERGQICIVIPKVNGVGEDTVIIPDTFIPVDLTEQVSKQQLIASSEFRKSLSSRRLELIEPERAEKLLSSQEARDERDRLFNLMEAHRNSVVELEGYEVDTGVVDPAMEGIMGESTAGMAAMGGRIDTGTNEVSISQVLLKLEEDNDEKAAIVTLRNISGMTRKDYKFTYKNCARKYKKVRTWARDKAEELKK